MVVVDWNRFESHALFSVLSLLFICLVFFFLEGLILFYFIFIFLQIFVFFPIFLSSSLRVINVEIIGFDWK